MVCKLQGYSHLPVDITLHQLFLLLFLFFFPPPPPPSCFLFLPMDITLLDEQNLSLPLCSGVLIDNRLVDHVFD